jgi:hypothetical protein
MKAVDRAATKVRFCGLNAGSGQDAFGHYRSRRSSLSGYS